MSEEATISEEPSVEENTTEYSGVEEAASFLESTSSGDSSGEVDFLASIGSQLDEAVSAESASPEDSPEDSPGDSVEETAKTDSTPESNPEETSESGSDSLVDDFPDADALSDTLSEKATAKWGELRSELAEARAKASELESKVGESTDKPLTTELEQQLTEAKSTIEEYEKELAVSRVEQSREYKDAVTAPLQAIMDAAEAISQRNEVDVNQVYDALTEVHNVERQNRVLEEITGEMTERDKMALYRMVDDAAVIFQKDTHLKEHAAEAAAELDQRNSEWEQEALKKHALETRVAVNKVFDKLENVIPDLEEADLSALRSKALEDDYLTLGAEHQAYALSAGSVLPPLVKAIRSRDAKISELETQLAGYQKATPKAAESGGGVNVDVSNRSDNSVGFLEAINKIIK